MSIERFTNDRDGSPLNISVNENVVRGRRLITIAGDSTAFRCFAGVLNEMADAVEPSTHPASGVGWSLVFEPQGPAHLTMEADDALTLDCRPVDQGRAD